MKAAVFYEHGGPEVLTIADLPAPEPRPGEALIRVRATSVNHLDLFVRKGIPGLKLEMPHIPGSDVAGVVEAVGDPADEAWVGKRVVIDPGLSCGRCEFCRRGEHSLCVEYRILGEHVRGGDAEYVTVPVENLYEIPDGVEFERAAAAPLVFLTAWRMLITRAQVRPGETVVVLGAGGGVATAAIQIARLAGARVIAVSSTEEKLRRAAELGAEELINYRTQDWSKEVYLRTGRRGADVIVDSVGEATWHGSIRAVRKGGRIVTCGATSGPVAPTDIRYVFWKQITILGSTMASRQEFREVMDLVFRGKLQPVIHQVLPLEEIRRAHEILEKGEQFGKVVLRID